MEVLNIHVSPVILSRVFKWYNYVHQGSPPELGPSILKDWLFVDYIVREIRVTKNTL